MAALSLAKPQPAPLTKSLRPETWRGVADWCARHGAGSLDARELSFVQDMARRLGRFREPTEKQAAWVYSLYTKLGGPE